MTRTSLLLLVVLLALAVVGRGRDGAGAQEAGEATASPETAQEVVDRAIEFHGGDLYRHSRSQMTIESRSGAFDLVVVQDGDRYEHTVTGESRGLDGEVAMVTVRATNDTVERWEDTVQVALDAEAAQRSRDFASARVYFPFLPFRLDDPSVNKEDLGFEEWDGRRLRKIKVSFDPGSSTAASDEYLYWFDPETGRLEQFAYSFRGGLRFREGFDHRRVGGILFFDSENWGVDEAGLSVDRVTPDFVRDRMRKISTVVLRDIEVEPLE